MTGLVSKPPAAPAGCGPTWETALAEAKDYLAATVEAVNADTPASDLVGFVAGYRAHLAALVAAATPGTPQ